MKHLIAPSILAADFSQLSKDIEMINRSEADWIHFDVMDGVFVPNISFGLPILDSIKPIAKKPIDVHLMIVQPEKYIETFAKSGANVITVHYETCAHLDSTIHKIKSLGCKVGVAINPHTSVSLLENVLSAIDMVLIMSVNPGFGGQKFIHYTYDKIRQLRKLADLKNPNLLIEIDGGVSNKNALELIQAGANVLVAGNAVFQAENPEKMIASLKGLSLNNYIV